MMQSYINVHLDSSYSRGESSSRRRVLQDANYKQDDVKGVANARLKYWLRKLVAFLFSQVGVGAILLLYTMLGATMFMSLEHKSSGRERLMGQMENLRSEVVLDLWNTTKFYNILYTDKWEMEVDVIVRNFEKKVVQHIRNGYTGERDDPWTFPTALMYSLSVYTTIGYGNLTPKTDWGKACTILYALFGIPLLLLYMANIGDLLAKSFREFYTSLDRCKRRIERFRKERELNEASRDSGVVVVIDHYSAELGQDWTLIKEKSEEDKKLVRGGNDEMFKTTIPISTCLGVFSCYIVLGAVVFSWWEGWNYMDGSYFCFVSLVTIGFGDLVPGQTLGRSAQQQGVDGQLILCSIYILLGMALMAMCFHLTQERFFISAKKLGKTLRLIS